MSADAELLRRYAAHRTEADFAELVRRHVNLVYSAALRQVNGDAHLAQDVTQEVFRDLAGKAAEVAAHRVLAAWLFTSTRFAAAKAVRAAQRRQAREQAAHLMEELNRDPAAPVDWERVRPVLDEVLAELPEAEREAILLRFFEGRDFAGVGAQLQLSPNAARMRVERALNQLHALLSRRGILSTTAALAAALAQQAVVAAPAGLAASVSGAVWAVGAGAAAGSAAGGGVLATFMSMTKLQIGIAGALAAAGAGGLVLQAQGNARLQAEVAALRQENGTVAPLRRANDELRRTAAEVAELQRDDAELARLNEEAVALRGRLQQVARAEQDRAATAAAAAQTFDLSKLDAAPRPTFQARPSYPAELRRAGITGTIVVEFIVDAEGNVRNAWPVQTSVGGPPAATPDAAPSAGVVRMSEFAVSGEATAGADSPAADAGKLLENAAVEAVSKWKFAAGKKGGRSVNTRMQIPIVFSVAPKK